MDVEKFYQTLASIIEKKEHVKIKLTFERRSECEKEND